MTALQAHAPTSGPAITFSAAIPDLHHYKGSFGGRVFPLWTDHGHRTPNLKAALLRAVSDALGATVTAPDMMAYFAAVAAHPAYTARFQTDLVQPGLRFPLSANAELLAEAVELGREIIWLHCFGQRFADPGAGRPNGTPRLPAGERPVIPAAGAIPTHRDRFPNRIEYDADARRLQVGAGFIDNVQSAVWEYEVSGKQVLAQWFSYRRRDRSRPIIGDRRPPSKLERVQPDGWLAEYTTELMNVLHVLGRLVALEPRQAELLARICGGPLLSADDLRASGVFDSSRTARRVSTDIARAHCSTTTRPRVSARRVSTAILSREGSDNIAGGHFANKRPAVCPLGPLPGCNLCSSELQCPSVGAGKKRVCEGSQYSPGARRYSPVPVWRRAPVS